MLKSKNLKLYLLVSLFGLGVIGSDIALIIQSQSLRNSSSTISNLKEQNKTLQAKLTELELASSQLQDKNKQLQSEMNDFMKLQMSEDKGEKPTSQSKEILAQKEKEYNKLKEEYNSLSQAYNDLMKEGLANPTQPQPEEEARRERLTQEQMDQMRTTMRERTSQSLDSHIREAKTEYEAGLLTEIKQASDNIFDLQEKFRTATDEERAALRDEMTEQSRALGQLYQDYNTYQWQSLGKEFGIGNTDEFVKRAQSLTQTNSPFGFFGRGGQQQRPQEEQPPSP